MSRQHRLYRTSVRGVIRHAGACGQEKIRAWTPTTRATVRRVPCRSISSAGSGSASPRRPASGSRSPGPRTSRQPRASAPSGRRSGLRPETEEAANRHLRVAGRHGLVPSGDPGLAAGATTVLMRGENDDLVTTEQLRALVRSRWSDRARPALASSRPPVLPRGGGRRTRSFSHGEKYGLGRSTYPSKWTPETGITDMILVISEGKWPPASQTLRRKAPRTALGRDTACPITRTAERKGGHGGAAAPQWPRQARPARPSLARQLSAVRRLRYPARRDEPNLFDNAMAESFNATIKKELIHLPAWRTPGLGTSAHEFRAEFPCPT
jgi:hypothetical protein